MNTAGSSNNAKAAGGYGNVEFNGLPATSTGYILDGFDSNDPFLGLNIGLSTNLVIGLDALQEATVNTNSYAVDQGRYGASQTTTSPSRARTSFTATCTKYGTVRYSTPQTIFSTPTTRRETLPRSRARL